MHGIGNDFVMINGFRESEPYEGWNDLALSICDRKYGVGADGLIIASPGVATKFGMRMFNPDGSESEMCGNGIRCYAIFVTSQELTNDREIPVETGAGLLHLTLNSDKRVTVDMGLARLSREEIGMGGFPEDTFISQPVGDYFGTAVSMGNPHLVIFVDDVANVPLAKVGPILEHVELFRARVNVHFVQVESRSHLIQRTWERGAGMTLACGTGACACAVAAFLNGLADRQVKIDLPGGQLQIHYLESGRVLMTGPAVTSFHGTWLG